MPKYGFKELAKRHPDPEIAGLLDDISSLLDAVLGDDSISLTRCLSVDSYTYPRHKRAFHCGSKRSISDRELETIFECYEYQQDVGTDPMPATDTSDKQTQVFSSELEHLELVREQSRLDSVSPPSSRIPHPRIRISNPSFKVFEEAGSHLVQAERQEIWTDVGLGSLFYRRRILASVDGAHPDTAERLEMLGRLTSNPFAAINRAAGIMTIDEFPITRINTRIIQYGNVINIGGEVVDRSEIGRYAWTNAQRLGISRNTLNPFVPVVEPRRQLAERAPMRNAVPFWQRLGIRVPVPRVWVAQRQPTIFTRDIQSSQGRVRFERS